MYQNHIPRKAENGHPQFFIDRSQIPIDPRVAYIESVCATLVESRFGPGRVSTIVISLSDRPELEPAVFYDIDDNQPDGLAPCYGLSPLGRAGYQVIEAAFQRAQQTELSAAEANATDLAHISCANQERGSP